MDHCIRQHVTTNIHTLDLSAWGLPDEALPHVFVHLTAPHLQTLKILWMYQPDPNADCDASPYWDSAIFDAFFTRSAVSLTSLTLLHADIPEAELIALFEATPLLIEFELSDRYTRRHWCDYDLHHILGPHLLERLLPSPPSGASVLVPKLEVLKLRGGFDGNEIRDADILRVFEARFATLSQTDGGTETESGYVACLLEGAFHLLRRAEQPAGELSLAERASRLRKRGLKFELTTMEPDPYDAEELEDAGDEDES
ncbi:hypothetical protein K438DRAFT_1840610, partial [Mycena galopus ATCC 62051]